MGDSLSHLDDLLIMIHKCMNGRAPGYLMNKFTRRSEVHDRNTRYNKDLNLPRWRTGQ